MNNPLMRDVERADGSAHSLRSTLMKAGKLALLYVVTSTAGYIANRAHIPLAWMIGPILATFALNLIGLAPRVPVQTRPFGQIVVATGIGMTFSPAALQMILSHFGAILGITVFTIVLSLAIARLLCAISDLDRVTAFLACMPNGPVEMANLATQYRAETNLVIATQTLRIVAVVLFVPVGVYLLHGELPEPIPLSRQPLTSTGVITLILTLTAALLVAGIFKRLSISNAFFLGPLLLAVCASTLSVPMTQWPASILAIAQILLGTWLGSQLGPELFRKTGRKLAASILSTVLLVGGCSLGALGFTFFSALDLETLILGAAPGGVTEMSLTAKVLGLDMIMITAFHVTRILIVMPNIPWIVRRLHGRTASAKE